MSIQNELKHAIQNVADKLGFSGAVVDLEIISETKFGDYSCNIAMQLASQAGKNPRDLAIDFCEKLGEEAIATKVAAIVPAGPGFINITLSPQSSLENVQLALHAKDSFGKSNIFADKKILVEHSSPNLFKPFHIGHVMNNTVGESLVRLMRAAGATVVPLSYPSDVSLGIGKAVWALLQNGHEALTDESVPAKDKLALMGDAYVAGTNAYEENEAAKEEIRAITREIYAGEKNRAWEVYQQGRDFNLEYFKEITARLGSHFDDFVFESEAGRVGKAIVEEYVGSIFAKSDGAVIYEGEADGLHTRVFINSEGNPTYEAKDIGLMSIKNERYQPDISITVTDHEQAAYFKVVAKAAGKINPVWEQNFVHVPHGRMQFKGKKMSSRLGGVPLAEDILAVVHEEVVERAADRNLPESTLDQVAIAALKFAILKSEAGKNINFDPDTSLSFEGDSGPYLQYTYARTQSLLRKGKEQGIGPILDMTAGEVGLVERKLLHYAEIVAKSQQAYAPHHVVGYLLELAREFNSWYGRERILDSEQASHSLAIVAAVGQVLHNGLALLAIDTPSEM